MSIIQVIRDAELKAIERASKSSDSFNERVHSKAEMVKSVISKTDPNAGVDVRVVSIKNLYYTFLENYTRDNSGVFSVPTKMNKRSISLWTRVEKKQRESGCTPTDYVKAQFDYFHTNFGKAPKISQLATDAALIRAVEYKGSSHGIVGSISHKLTSVENLIETEKRLQKMLLAQKCTREEFYRKFIVTGLYILPAEFLAKDPVYKKVVNG